MKKVWTKRLGGLVFASRWILYPLSVAIILALGMYIVAFLVNEVVLIRDMFRHWSWEMEPLMVLLCGFVDAYMVANLTIMVTQGSFQIFIHRFDIDDEASRPQWLDHMDSGILKTKIALSIAGITLIQVLKDFVHIESIDWTLTKHRIIIHLVALFSALMMSLNWRITHPAWAADQKHEEHQ